MSAELTGLDIRPLVAGDWAAVSTIYAAGIATRNATFEGCAARLYLVTEELLAKAHETKDTNLHVIKFFVGFIFLFTLEGIA